MNLKKFYTFILVNLLFPLSTQALSDGDFEKILIDQNQEFKALHLKKEALKGNEEEADTLYAWQLVGDLGWQTDKAPSTDPNFTYKSLSTLQGNLGFQKSNSWGLETKIALYSLQKNITKETPPNLKSWQSKPSIQLRLPVISGGFGRKVRSQHSALSLQKKADALMAEIEYDQKLQEAKTLLWSCVLQQEAILSQSESLDRIKKIFNIAQTQANRNLAATSNLLQAKSALEQTELELQVAQLKGAQLERLLNLVLNKHTELLNKHAELVLPKYDFTKFSKIQESDFLGKISAQDQLDSMRQKELSQAARIAYEDKLPSLNVLGTYSQNGNNSSLNKSLNESLHSEFPTLFLGLELRIPLDLSLANKSRARQNALLQAAELRKDYLERDQNPTLMKDLVNQYNQSIELLNMTLKLEKTQSAKVNNERSMLKQGRSSMYQLLQFEMELSRAKAAKYSLALDVEKLHQKLSLKKYTKYE